MNDIRHFFNSFWTYQFLENGGDFVCKETSQFIKVPIYNENKNQYGFITIWLAPSGHA
jgi:hypothetical protein